MRTILILLCTVTLSARLFSQTISIDDPATYLPTGLTNIKLGSGITEFQVKRDTTKMRRDITYGYLFVAFSEGIKANNIDTVRFKFDTPQLGKNPERPLYELAITFTDSASADNFVTSKFTSMYRITEAADKEWLLSTNKDYWMLVRMKGNQVLIAAMMNGTEWGFE